MTANCSEGLGFRDLHGFNVALLGEHILKFCQRPNSMVSRLFRARYFQDNHILQASKGTLQVSFGMTFRRRRRN